MLSINLFKSIKNYLHIPLIISPSGETGKRATKMNMEFIIKSYKKEWI